MSDFVGTEKMNMAVVRNEIKPWTDKEGKARYYVDVERVISYYRTATNSQLRSYYDWDNMCASSGRVRERIEANILPKTKAFIDEDGLVHVYGYGAHGMGESLAIPELIEKGCVRCFGFRTEEERAERFKVIGEIAFDPKVGDTVRIEDGRKEVGKVFVVAKVSTYYFSRYRSPSVTLYDSEGFHVNADHCVTVDVGYSW